MDIAVIKKKTEPITADELKYLEAEFRKKLKADGLSQNDWAINNRILSGHVSNVLLGTHASSKVVAKICDYLMETT